MSRSVFHIAMLAVAVLLTATALAAPGLGAVPRALAHAEVERASPAINSTIQEAPARLDVWFTQELFRRAGANVLEVVAPDGTSVTTGDVIYDADRTHLSVPLARDLEPGTYTVQWHSLSAIDGDEADGSFTFTIDPSAPPSGPETTPVAAATTAPTAEATAPPLATATSTVTDQSAGFPWWALAAAAAILAAGGIGAWTLRAPADADTEAP